MPPLSGAYSLSVPSSFQVAIDTAPLRRLLRNGCGVAVDTDSLRGLLPVCPIRGALPFTGVPCQGGRVQGTPEGPAGTIRYLWCVRYPCSIAGKSEGLA